MKRFTVPFAGVFGAASCEGDMGLIRPTRGEVPKRTPFLEAGTTEFVHIAGRELATLVAKLATAVIILVIGAYVIVTGRHKRPSSRPYSD